MKRRRVLFALTMVQVMACGKDDPPEERTPDLLLPLREAEHSTPSLLQPQSDPGLTQHLIAQQRQLFTILSGNDRAQLPHYAAPTYVWRYGLKALPTNYHVFPQRGGFADVIASHEPDGPSFVTTWRLTKDGWRATETREVAAR